MITFYIMEVRTEMERGVTLVELLIVIAIIGILAVVIIFPLDPIQHMRQARDSARMTELTQLRTAIATYATTVSGGSLGLANTCYAHAASGLANCTSRFASGGTAVTTTSVAVDGNGWLPINFSQMNLGGNILGALPKDPVNNATFFYAYKADPVSMYFELNDKMESNKFKNGGNQNLESTDGGDDPDLFEIGTNLNL